MAFTFTGFPLGSAVSVSALQNGLTVSDSVATWGQANLGTVDINKIESELAAPAAVWFEAVNVSGFNVPAGAAPGEVYEPGFHDITFIWDFGESGDTTFAAPLNIPDAWNDRNIAYGRRAAHVYRNPGTYTVTLWCVDSDGTVGQQTTTVTVVADTLFAGARTICFAADGDFSGAPSGAQQVTSAAALQTAIANLSQSGQVLFRRGSVTANFSLVLAGSAFNRNVRFGAWGSGARPVLSPPRDGTLFHIDQNTPIKERIFNGLDLRGSWDPTRETGGNDNPFGTLLSDAADMLHLVHDCRMSGFNSVNLSTLKPQAFISIVNDSLIEDWYGYGYFAHNQNDGLNPNSRMALIGTAVQQNPDAANGNIGEGYGLGMTTEQGPLRYASTQQFLLRCAYFFSNTTWSGDAQPCVRAASGNEDCELIADRVVLEGGTNPLELQKTAGTDRGNFLCDRMLLLGTADTNVFVKTAFSGLTMRNVYGWMPDVPRNPGPGQAHFAKTGGGVLAEAVRLSNATVVYMPPGGDVPLVDQGFLNDFLDVTVENTLHHAPNQNTPLTADDPDLSGTIAGVTPRYAGRRNSIRKPSANASGSSNTLVFSYPAGQGGTGTTGPSDYDPNGRHWVRNTSNNGRFYREDGDFTVSLGASNVTLTRTSGAWPAGDYRLGMDYLNYVTDASRASPGAVPLPVPKSGTPPYRSGGQGAVAIDDLLLVRRPGLPVPNSPGGTASKGAVEP